MFYERKEEPSHISQSVNQEKCIGRKTLIDC